MRNLVFILLMLFGISLNSSAQKKLPEAVEKSFSQKFSEAKSIKWSNESANEWEAEFVLNGKKMSASFDNSGNWFETETELALKDLPEAVTSTLNREFAGYRKGESSILENPTVKGYEIALKKSGSEIEVVIDVNGKLLKHKSEKGDNKKQEK